MPLGTAKINNLQWVESVHAEPTDTEGRLYQKLNYDYSNSSDTDKISDALSQAGCYWLVVCGKILSCDAGQRAPVSCSSRSVTQSQATDPACPTEQQYLNQPLCLRFSMFSLFHQAQVADSFFQSIKVNVSSLKIGARILMMRHM
ncbi:uncharacterized protein AAG666_020200 [Megaptera novaeangliae]